MAVEYFSLDYLYSINSKSLSRDAGKATEKPANIPRGIKAILSLHQQTVPVSMAPANI